MTRYLLLLTLSAVFALALATMLAGCVNATLALYPEFPDKKAAMKDVMIVADHVVIDRTVSDTSIVDVAGNKNAAVEIMDEMSSALASRAYPVGTKLLSSMGLIMNQSSNARVINSAEDRQIGEERLSVQSPPFYVYRVFQKDSTLLRLLSGFYASLINTSKYEGDPNPVVREAVPLGRVIGGDTWIVLLSGSYNIPPARELGQLSGQSSLTMEKVSQREVTQITMMLYVVDMKTGEVIWNEKRHETGGSVHRARLVRAATQLVGSMP